MSETQTPSKPAPRSRKYSQKVPAFARYEGTSAWKKNRRRVRAYAQFRAAASKEKAAQSA
jgi:hypothetical protein